MSDSYHDPEPFVWPEDGSMEALVPYRRYEDMSPDGWLQVMVEPGGDVIVTVFQSEENSIGRARMASVQFCTSFGGGGQSRRVRDALLRLIQAIQADNAERPQERE